MYTLKEQNKQLLLIKDEQEQMCPHQTKLLIPGRLQNTLDLQQFSCNSQCALFEFVKDKNQLHLHCGNRTIENISIEADNNMRLFTPAMGKA